MSIEWTGHLEGADHLSGVDRMGYTGLWVLGDKMERDDELICKLTARLCTLSVFVQAASVRTSGQAWYALNEMFQTGS